MIIYADTNDLETGNWFTPDTLPANAEALLRDASRLVAKAVRRDLYNTQPSGLPEDDELREAMRDATCQQVLVWDTAKINPASGGIYSGGAVISSQSTPGGSVSYDTGLTAEQTTKAAETLSTAAMDILRLAGLCTTAPRTW